ncbi:MAG: hypothetical protein KC910_22845 [Candidatus Eremiobacteraeota bacterium]|nr:hypothetical protein [Candidatus Eremiobacteraeota bacterium]
MLPGGHDRIDIHLQGDDYKNIPRLEAAQMLGYFTQTLENAGFPWRVHAAVPTSNGQFKTGPQIGEMDALSSLQEGKPIMLQPMRNMQFDLSSGSLTGLATAGSLVGNESISKVATFSKNAQVSGGTQGFEVRFGEPVVVQNVPELKLLFQMYNPDEKIKGNSDIAKSAHRIAFFTQGTANSTRPWRFYVDDNSNVAWRVTKEVFKKTPYAIALGAVAGAAMGGVFAWLARSWEVLGGFAAAGAVISGAGGAYDAVRTASKGKGINAVEALERVLEGKPVHFQESKAWGFDVPILKRLSWYVDNGKASTIKSAEELETFYYMQSQAELPKEEKKEEEKKPDPPQIVIVDNRSYHTHQHFGEETQVVAGDAIHQHPTKTVIVEGY